MSSKFYGAQLGQQIPELVTTSGSTTGMAVELRVDDSMFTNKLDVILALKAIQAYLDTRETSPVA